MKPAILNNASRAINKFGFKIKQHSPEILIATGVVGVVASTVMACKATTKADEILEKAKQEIEHTKQSSAEVLANEELAEKYGYTETAAKKELAEVYIKTGLEFVKLYAPSVILGALSLTCIIQSHNILKKRNVALAAAYTAVDKGFKEYRGRVVERFGEKLDRELQYDIKAKEIEETVMDENGKEKTVKKTVEVANPQAVLSNPYAVCFDDTCTAWRKNAEANKFFLIQQQNYANEKLKSKGYLALNDVYEMVGVQMTEQGRVVGWVYNEQNPVPVDFGIFDIHSEPARNFVNGYEKSVWLNFNVQGLLADLK